MKQIFFFSLFFLALFCGCNNQQKNSNSDASVADTIKQKFFPVTAFLKGEIFGIKKNGINPLKFTTVNNHTDSVWVKIEELDSNVNQFLTPVIDSSNLTNLFTEKSFLDQSINAITLTYDPKSTLPSNLFLKHWDVYIDPKTDKVKRVYIVKEPTDSLRQQLTWVSGKWCKITSIVTDKSGTSSVTKEVKLVWDF